MMSFGLGEENDMDPEACLSRGIFIAHMAEGTTRLRSAEQYINARKLIETLRGITEKMRFANTAGSHIVAIGLHEAAIAVLSSAKRDYEDADPSEIINDMLARDSAHHG